MRGKMRGQIKPFRRPAIALALYVILLVGLAPMQGCGPSDLSKLHDTLNKTAKALNAAAKTNHSFYESGMYGAVASDGAIRFRQKAATVIHDSNEKLIVALNLAKGLTKETFEQGKLAVLQALSQAASGLRTGNAAIDLVLASIATLITQAVTLVQLFKASDIKYVVPMLREWQIPAMERA